MPNRSVWLIELKIDGKTGFFTGRINQELTPLYTTTPLQAKEYDSEADARFARFYFSLHGSHVEEHMFG